MILNGEFTSFNQMNLSSQTPLVKVPGKSYFLVKLEGT